MIEYSVWAETHEGNTLRLRGGFNSRSAAEDHPVTMKLWKRVWIEESQARIQPPPEAKLPPLPWSWVAASTSDHRGVFHAYLVDATGRKIAAIWGRDQEKKMIADFIVERANQ